MVEKIGDEIFFKNILSEISKVLYNNICLLRVSMLYVYFIHFAAFVWVVL